MKARMTSMTKHLRIFVFATTLFSLPPLTASVSEILNNIHQRVRAERHNTKIDLAEVTTKTVISLLVPYVGWSIAADHHYISRTRETHQQKELLSNLDRAILQAKQALDHTVNYVSLPTKANAKKVGSFFREFNCCNNKEDARNLGRRIVSADQQGMRGLFAGISYQSMLNRDFYREMVNKLKFIFELEKDQDVTLEEIVVLEELAETDALLPTPLFL